jgi:hypothetical protein
MSTERQQQAANCRLESWRRLYPVLAALHVSRDDGPEALVDELHDAPLVCRAEATRILRAFSAYNWRVERLQGPFSRNPRLGFRVLAGNHIWWLRFEPSPRLVIRHIERVNPKLTDA